MSVAEDDHVRPWGSLRLSCNALRQARERIDRGGFAHAPALTSSATGLRGHGSASTASLAKKRLRRGHRSQVKDVAEQDQLRTVCAI